MPTQATARVCSEGSVRRAVGPAVRLPRTGLDHRDDAPLQVSRVRHAGGVVVPGDERFASVPQASGWYPRSATPKGPPSPKDVEGSKRVSAAGGEQEGKSGTGRMR